MLLCFDAELSGERDPFIVTGAVVMLDAGKVRWSKELMADPINAITPEATALHGISTEYAHIHGMPHANVVALLAGYVYKALQDSIPVVVFNARLKLTVLHRWAETYGIVTPRDYTGVYDPMVIDLVTEGHKEPRHLNDVAINRGVYYSEHHMAAADAELAGLTLLAQLKDFPVLEKLDLELQRKWSEHESWPIDYAVLQLHTES